MLPVRGGHHGPIRDRCGRLSVARRLSALLRVLRGIGRAPDVLLETQ